MNLLRAWRERGWREIDAATYAAAWQRFGGSVATHPAIVERLSALAELPVRYLAWPLAGEPLAAIACWGSHLALAKEVLKRKGKRGLFDLGNAEVIVPVAMQARVPLRHHARFVSALHEQQIDTLHAQPEGIALARAPEEYSSKFRYNQRRELRLLQEAGGSVLPLGDFSPAQQAEIYADLFARRWGFAPKGCAHLASVLRLLREFVAGSLLLLRGEPIAIQLLYRVESPRWLSVEFINGGVDPKSRTFSPGSVLTFLNTQAAWDEARALGKDLRYSFGRADRGYKDRWCREVAAYRV